MTSRNPPTAHSEHSWTLGYAAAHIADIRTRRSICGGPDDCIADTAVFDAVCANASFTKKGFRQRLSGTLQRTYTSGRFRGSTVAYFYQLQTVGGMVNR